MVGGGSDPCSDADMWLSSSPSGSFAGSNTICFKKNTIGGEGTDNLFIFYMSASSPACAFGDNRVAYCTRSWWSGEDPGLFFQPQTGPTFTAYQRCNGCAIGNWGWMGFF
ncbi:MAG TPA: hypothetical protein VHP33_07985 [Polyangiaceae bacterium]|nr:hypothetical protein [Polyangiaceae bacterium]